MKPIAWYRDENGIRMYYDAPYFDDAKPLYSAQREWVGLTREEVLDMEDATSHPLEFARTIEDKLKEKNDRQD